MFKGTREIVIRNAEEISLRFAMLDGRGVGAKQKKLDNLQVRHDASQDVQMEQMINRENAICQELKEFMEKN